MPGVQNQYFEGFEGYGSTAGTTTNDAGWIARDTAVSYETGRFGVGTCVFLNRGNNGTPGGIYHSWPDGTDTRADFSVAAAIKINGYGSGYDGLAVGYTPDDTNARHLYTNVHADGRIDVVNSAGTTLCFTEIDKVSPVNWHFWSMRGKIATGTGGFVELRIDGDLVASAYDINTKNASSGIKLVSGCMISQTIIGETWVDDFAMNSAGVLIPENRIDPLLVDGDGSVLMLVPSTGTSHFAMVDETPANVTDWLSGTAIGDLDELTLQNMGFTPDQILGVRVKAVINKTDAATRAWNLGIKQGATVANATADDYIAASARWYDRFFWDDPVSGVAFTKANIDSLQVRPRITV